MAVTLPKQARSKSKKRASRTMKPKKTLTRRSPPAAALSDPRYRKRVTKSAKAYRRKAKARILEEEEA